MLDVLDDDGDMMGRNVVELKVPHVHKFSLKIPHF